MAHEAIDSGIGGVGTGGADNGTTAGDWFFQGERDHE